MVSRSVRSTPDRGFRVQALAGFPGDLYFRNSTVSPLTFYNDESTQTSDWSIFAHVQTTPEVSEKAAFFPPVRPTVHTNPSRKRSFLKTLLKPEEF